MMIKTILISAVLIINSLLNVDGFSIMPVNKRVTKLFQSITQGVIIGGGRIGDLLFTSNDKKDVLLDKRGQDIPNIDGPIYVATRNNDLDDIIKRTPINKLPDLVFLQNGMLSNYLTEKQLNTNTQGLIYFAVAKKGDSPIDGKTELNPEGLTAVTGKWADDFALRIRKANLSCHVLNQKEWFIAMLEKHIWICAFMAIGVKYGVTVGEVESKHKVEVGELINELARAASKVGSKAIKKI